MSSMAILVFMAFVLLLAVLSPWLGTDSSDAKSERSRPVNGWWPGQAQQH